LYCIGNIDKTRKSTCAQYSWSFVFFFVFICVFWVFLFLIYWICSWWNPYTQNPWIWKADCTPQCLRFFSFSLYVETTLRYYFFLRYYSYFCKITSCKDLYWPVLFCVPPCVWLFQWGVREMLKTFVNFSVEYAFAWFVSNKKDFKESFNSFPYWCILSLLMLKVVQH
jgi:hypothetical protein